jgi:hypothetical protein
MRADVNRKEREILRMNRTTNSQLGGVTHRHAEHPKGLPFPEDEQGASRELSECRWHVAPDDSPKAQTTSPPLINQEGACLLHSLWAGGLSYQLAFMRRGRKFHNVAVAGVEAALHLALQEAARDSDIYFACAEYGADRNRKAANAIAARAFWIDIDCGAQKAASGRGYATQTEALAALLDFCKGNALAEPTHIVDSGGGLHVYWAFTGSIERWTWLTSARQLKRLTTSSGLMADPSRTADIASVLRLPGTLNQKYTPPRPVSLLKADDSLHAHDFLTALRNAHERLCVVAGRSQGPAAAEPIALFEHADAPPSLARLAVALRLLNPDCDEATWKLRRLAPMARAARMHPDLEPALKALASAWSSGELRGRCAASWTSPGRTNGIPGQVEFERAWRRFLVDDYSGRPATLGTIYHDAMLEGFDRGRSSR